MRMLKVIQFEYSIDKKIQFLVIFQLEETINIQKTCYIEDSEIVYFLSFVSSKSLIFHK